MIEVCLFDRDRNNSASEITDPFADVTRVVLPSVPRVGEYVSLDNTPDGLRRVESVAWVVTASSVVVEVAKPRQEVA
jgi:hypothetical protein